MPRFNTILKLPFLTLIGILLCVPGVSVSQSKKIVENGAVFKFKRKWYKHNMVYGSLLQSDNGKQNVETMSGDTISFPTDSARKYYLPEQITLYDNGRYNYAKGKTKNLSIGMSRDHVNLDFVYGYRVNKHLDIGVGIGFDHNAFYFHTTNDFHDIRIVGSPLFIQSRYNMYFKRRCLYLKGKVGMNNNSEAGNITEINNGLVLEGGAGILFPSRINTRFYFEFSQYTSHAVGAANVASPDVLSDVEFDVWFHRFLFTLGVEFGK